MGTEQVSRYVVGLLSTALAGQAVVDPASVLPLSSGASRQTWSFAAEKPDGMRCQYVLQSHLAVALPGFDPAEAGLDMGGQATLMRKAAEAGVPAPAVVAVGEHAGVPYLVTEWLPGEALPHRLLRDPELAPGVGRLMQDAASALARLHQLDPAAAPLPEQDQLARYRRRLDEIGEPRPVLELAYRWLELHRPAPGVAGVVHGDFRLGNLLVDVSGLRAILDWELAHLGDPYEDLAWPTIRAWRFDRYRPLGSFPETEPWLAAYEAEAGVDVDRDAVRWWQVAGTWTWAVISAMQARRHLLGPTPSLEHAAIGRRVCESEYDLLELLP